MRPSTERAPCARLSELEARAAEHRAALLADLEAEAAVPAKPKPGAKKGKKAGKRVRKGAPAGGAAAGDGADAGAGAGEGTGDEEEAEDGAAPARAPADAQVRPAGPASRARARAEYDSSGGFAARGSRLLSSAAGCQVARSGQLHSGCTCPARLVQAHARTLRNGLDATARPRRRLRTSRDA